MENLEKGGLPSNIEEKEWHDPASGKKFLLRTGLIHEYGEVSGRHVEKIYGEGKHEGKTAGGEWYDAEGRLTERVAYVLGADGRAEKEIWYNDEGEAYLERISLYDKNGKYSGEEPKRLKK